MKRRTPTDAFAALGSRALVARVFAETLGYSAAILVDAARGALDEARMDDYFDRWSRRLYATGQLSLDVAGTEHIVRGTSYVVMSNHASLVDVPSVLRAFPGRLRFVAKKELADIPLFGPAMRKAGTIVIDREDRQAAIAALQDAKTLVTPGTSLWVAPEGTRSKTGLLGPFKKGGFHVAIDLALPILPVWIEGSREVLETKTLRAHPGKTVQVRFGAPISTTGVVKTDLDALQKKVRRALLELAFGLGGPASRQLDDERASLS
jgi:1-acyl-sn-glycerol-3-phosphate acyltransferase